MSRDSFRDRPMPTLWEPRRGADAAPPVDCFADEIAIDFPAVRPLAERECLSFLGERHGLATLTTEVSLSRRDAFHGAVVPLEVPLRGTCAVCGGRGETWTEPCARCDGTGNALVRHSMRLTVPPGVCDGARFRFRITTPHAAPVRVEIRVRLEM